VTPTALWLTVLLASAGCYLVKWAGLSVPERVLRDPRVDRVATMLPIALLAALIAVQTFAEGTTLRLDARVAGVAAAIVAVLLRLPFLVVVLAAMVTTALLRW
jgi:branched-subunit amino acid transport protein